MPAPTPPGPYGGPGPSGYGAPAPSPQGPTYPPAPQSPYAQAVQQPPAYAPPYGQPPAYGYPAPLHPTAPATSGTALTSLIVGVVGVIPCLWFVSPIAVITGHLGLRDTNPARPDARTGRGQAVAGLVLGYLGLAFLVAFAVWAAQAAMIGIEAYDDVTSSYSDLYSDLPSDFPTDYYTDGGSDV